MELAADTSKYGEMSLPKTASLEARTNAEIVFFRHGRAGCASGGQPRVQLGRPHLTGVLGKVRSDADPGGLRAEQCGRRLAGQTWLSRGPGQHGLPAPVGEMKRFVDAPEGATVILSRVSGVLVPDFSPRAWAPSGLHLAGGAGGFPDGPLEITAGRQDLALRHPQEHAGHRSQGRPWCRCRNVRRLPSTRCSALPPGLPSEGPCRPPRPP